VDTAVSNSVIDRSSDPKVKEGLWFPKLNPVYSISIRLRRWKACEKRLKPCVQDNLIHWKGTDGRRLDMGQWREENKIDPKRVFTRGQVGCYDSHRRVWQDMVDKQLPYALILEDDAGISCKPDMVNKIEKVLQDVEKYDSQWQLLYLARSKYKQPVKKKLTNCLAIPKHKSWGCFAYALSQSGAQLLLAKSGRMNHTLDSYVSMMSSRHLRTYTAWPSLFFVIPYASDTNNIK
jgi:GR25 family glycosyltransferase involved in LPS biosynthesis